MARLTSVLDNRIQAGQIYPSSVSHIVHSVVFWGITNVDYSMDFNVILGLGRLAHLDTTQNGVAFRVSNKAQALSQWPSRLGPDQEN